MSKQNGFLQLRRGLWEHVRDGRMSVTEALVFIYICSEADTRTGIWKGCAKSVSGELGIPERTARDVLEKMEHGDYIRRFAVPGRHSCYPILVHKFTITQGEHNGEQLDALNSLDANTLRYLPVETREHGVEHNGEHGVEHGAAQRRIENGENRKEKKHTAAKPAPSSVQLADSLELETKEAAFGVFWEQYPRKQDKQDARRAWMKIPISEYAAVMAGLEKWQKSDQWARDIIPHPATWLNQKRWQDEDIPQKGVGNGKQSIRSSVETTLASHVRFEQKLAN